MIEPVRQSICYHDCYAEFESRLGGVVYVVDKVEIFQFLRGSPISIISFRYPSSILNRLSFTIHANLFFYFCIHFYLQVVQD